MICDCLKISDEQTVKSEKIELQFLALLAKGQKGLCRGDLSVVRACVRASVRP